MHRVSIGAASIIGFSCLVLPAHASVTTLDNFESANAPAPWVFGNGPEFPGATGSLTITSGRSGHVAHLAYDFGCTGPTATCDPHYVEARFTLSTPLVAAAIGLWARVSQASVVIRVTDSTNQTLQYATSGLPLEASDLLAWFPVTAPLGTPSGYWGGANDGVLHGTISAISVLAEGTAAHGTGYFEFDDVQVASTASELVVSSFTVDPATAAFAPIDAGSAQLSPRLGINIHFTKDDRALDAAKTAGVTWARMDLAWAGIETTQGNYDFSAFDTLVSALEARSMRGLFILDYGNPLYTAGAMVPPRTTDAIKAFGNYVEASARHYASHDITFEVWNEPDITGFWSPTPNVTEYEAVLREGIARVHTGNTSAKVWTGGLSEPSPANLAMLDSIFTSGSATGADGVGMHLYVWSAPESRWPDVLRLRELIGSELNGVPLYCTEWGYNSTRYSPSSDGHDATGRQRQAVMAVRELLTGWRAGLPLVVYYDIRDDGTDAANTENNFGLLANDYSDKPAMLAVRQLSSIAGSRRLTGVASGMPNGVHVFYLDGASPVLVAWNEVTNQTASMRVPFASIDSVSSMTGTAISVTNNNGYGTVTLDEASGPVYITLRAATPDAGVTGTGGTSNLAAGGSTNGGTGGTSESAAGGSMNGGAGASMNSNSIAQATNTGSCSCSTVTHRSFAAAWVLGVAGLWAFARRRGRR